MNKLKLNAYKIDEIQFVNKIKANTKIELKNSYAYNVRYTNNNICEGKFTVTITDRENPDTFGIKLVLAGIFSYPDDLQRELIHIRTYKELFPYARAIITTITANAGIQPIMIPDMDIENREIYRFDKPKKTGEAE